MDINKKELVAAVNTITKLCKPKTSRMAILNYAIINENGIFFTDLDMSVQVWLSIQGRITPTLVNFFAMKKELKSLEGPIISINGDTIVDSSGFTTSWRQDKVSIDDYPARFPNMDNMKVIELPNFAPAMSMIKYPDVTKQYNNRHYVLEAIHIGPKGYTAMDTHRAVRYCIELDQTLLVPRQFCLGAATLKNPVFMTGEKEILAVTDTIIYSTHLVEGEYPDLDRIIPEVRNDLFTVDIINMIIMLNRFQVSDRNKGIRIVADSNGIALSRTDADRGISEATVSGTVIQDCDLLIDKNYLVDTLSHTTSTHVTFSQDDVKHACRFFFSDDPEITAILMPLRR